MVRVFSRPFPTAFIPSSSAAARTRTLADHGGWAGLEVARPGDGALASQTGTGGMWPTVRRTGRACERDVVEAGVGQLVDRDAVARGAERRGRLGTRKKVFGRGMTSGPDTS